MKNIRIFAVTAISAFTLMDISCKSAKQEDLNASTSDYEECDTVAFIADPETDPGNTYYDSVQGKWVGPTADVINSDTFDKPDSVRVLIDSTWYTVY